MWNSNAPVRNDASINIYDSGSDLFKNFVTSDFMWLGSIKKKISAKSDKENLISGNFLKQDSINRSINWESKGTSKKKSINVKSK